MKKIEKLATVLIILYSLQAVLAGLTPFWIFQIANSHSTTFLNLLKMIGLSFSAITSIGTGIVCGIWLFAEAKREGYSSWLWCLAGLVLRLDALILFFVWLAFQEIRQMRIKNDATPDGNTVGDTDTVK
ncbi:MAG: hypothetical protein WC701_09985 [Kiritimatiellales bacterium]